MNDTLFSDQADCATITRAYPTLPVHVKAAIMALVGVKPAKVTKKPAAKGPYNAVPLWMDAWKDWNYHNPTLSGVECKWLKDLAGWYSQDQLVAMMKLFIKKTRSTSNVWAFYQQRNEYAAQCQPAATVKDPDAVLAELENEK